MTVQLKMVMFIVDVYLPNGSNIICGVWALINGERGHVQS